MNELSEVIRTLKTALDRIDQSLARGNLPVVAMEEFKMVLDDVRTSLLALVVASDPSDYGKRVRWLRIHRAAQVCDTTLESLAEGSITERTPGYTELKSITTQALEQVGPLAET
jgi:hypothetical protein